MQKEIEIKFKIEPEDNIRERLFSLGGTVTKSYSQITYGFFIYLNFYFIKKKEYIKRKTILGANY